MFRRKNKKKKRQEEEELQPYMMGPDVEFKAMGAGDDQKDQANLIQARQSMGIVTAKEMLAHATSRRAERIMLDFTAQQVGVRHDIDGLWHPADPLDRASGDMMLAVLKKISNLNIQDRRSRQRGKFQAKYEGVKYDCTITSQGTQTGERAILDIWDKKNEVNKPALLGMREKMIEQYKELVDATSGLFVISAPPNRGGLTTTWISALGGTDRYMRDFMAVYDTQNIEPEVENVDIMTYDGAAGETPDQHMKKLFLKQPEVVCVPEIPNSETLNALLDVIVDDEICVFTSVRAKDASEALLRVMMLKPDMQKFAKTLSFVLNTRLVRRLCEKCKQPFQPPPALLQKLGIPQGRVSVFFRQYQPAEGS